MREADPHLGLAALPATPPAPASWGPWFGLVGLLLATALLAVTALQVRQYSLLKLAAHSQDEYLVFSLYPLESEYERLRAVWRGQWGDAGENANPDPAALQLRYDIFVSRIALMQTARAARDAVGAEPRAGGGARYSHGGRRRVRRAGAGGAVAAIVSPSRVPGLHQRRYSGG